MKKLISLWENQSKNGNTYFTGKLGEVEIVGFRNNKTKDTQPDLIIYVKEENKQEQKETKKEDNRDVFADFGSQVEIDDNFLE